MQTTNAICQRIGHKDSGRKHASGLPICLTCGKPFDDDDGVPVLIVNTFPDPDGPALCQRRFAPKATPAQSQPEFSPPELLLIDATMSQLCRMLGRSFTFTLKPLSPKQ